ncbi:MAG: MTAP family purine nucleoside phosphorylase [Chloroflexota bacterium]
MTLGIIGGSGVYSLDVPGERREVVSTAFGDVAVSAAEVAGVDVIFLPRHGSGHAMAPHRVPHRSHLLALAARGAERVVALCTVGSLDPEAPPGSWVSVDDFLDTTGQPWTVWGDSDPVVHVDMTKPRCPELADILAGVWPAVGYNALRPAVYAMTAGPRLETPAEIRALRGLGATVVGMTVVPEMIMARELGICYAAAGLVVNWAAGFRGDQVDQGDIVRLRQASAGRLPGALSAVCGAARERPRSCDCFPPRTEGGV